MDVVDHALAVQSFLPLLTMRKVHSTWLIAFWKSYRPLYRLLAEGDNYPWPPFVREGFRHFVHNRSFLCFCAASREPVVKALQLYYTPFPLLEELAVLCGGSGNLDVLSQVFSSRGITRKLVTEVACRACDAGKVSVFIMLRGLGDLAVEVVNNMDAPLRASQHGSVDILRYLKDELNYTQSSLCGESNQCIEQACLNGHVNVIQLLHKEFGLRQTDFMDSKPRTFPILAACKGGSLSVVEYVHRVIGFTFDSRVGRSCMAKACEVGCTKLVRYLHKKCCINLTASDHGAIKATLRNGHTDVIRYLHRHAGLGEWIEQCDPGLACSSGHLETVMYLHKAMGVGFTRTNIYCDDVCRGGHLEVVRYLREEAGVSFGNSLWAACEGRQVSLIRYLAQNCPGLEMDDGGVLEELCSTGRADVLKELAAAIGKRGVTSLNLLHAAVRGGQMAVVKLLIRWGGFTLEQIMEYRSPGNAGTCIVGWAARNGDVPMLKYLHEIIGLPRDAFSGDSNYSARWAARGGHVEAVRYLHEEVGLTTDDFRDKDNEAFRLSASNGHLGVVKYLHENVGLTRRDCRARKCEAVVGARVWGHKDVLSYLVKHVGLRADANLQKGVHQG